MIDSMDLEMRGKHLAMTGMENGMTKKVVKVREMYFCLIQAMDCLTTARDKPSSNQTGAKSVLWWGLY